MAVIEEVRDRFFADLAHELITPIAILKSNLEILSGNLAGDKKLAIKSMNLTADRMSQLINGFLRAARMDFNPDISETLDKSIVSVRYFLEEIRDDCLALAEGRGVAISCSSDDSYMQADVGRMREVILNLISNALKYTPSGGEVKLIGKSAPGGVEIAARDTGEGIDPGELPHIFDRFYRIPSNASEGTGIGLHIAKKIVEAHCGSITAESEPNKGSRFTIFLPEPIS